jgi:hypothetical protein
MWQAWGACHVPVAWPGNPPKPGRSAPDGLGGCRRAGLSTRGSSLPIANPSTVARPGPHLQGARPDPADAGPSDPNQPSHTCHMHSGASLPPVMTVLPVHCTNNSAVGESCANARSCLTVQPCDEADGAGTHRRISRTSPLPSTAASSSLCDELPSSSSSDRSN